MTRKEAGWLTFVIIIAVIIARAIVDFTEHYLIRRLGFEKGTAMIIELVLVIVVIIVAVNRGWITKDKK